MNFTEQYFRDSQKVIMGVLNGAREELLQAYGNVKVDLKHDKSVVTELDRSLEIKLKTALSKFDTKAGFLGEEHGQSGSKDAYWLIDPIDGTEYFIRGIPQCRNILSFVADNKVQYALIYRFVTDDLFTAVKGHGAYKNGQPIKVNNQPLDRAWIEFSVKMMEDKGYKMYQAIRDKIAGITVHQDFMNVAEGKMEGMVVYHSAGEIWDYAPRTLLIQEAGGLVANIGSDDYDIYNFDFVAANPVIFSQLHKLLSAEA